MPSNGPIASKELKKTVIRKTWDYINDNFHKFNDNNKIKIALAVMGKDMPNKIEGELTTYTKMDRIEKDGKPMEHKVGS